jgi:hypothetical protein
MIKIKKTVTAFLMSGLALAAMNSGAAAEIATNALTPNALTPNALTPNALTPNALTPNALTPNGQRGMPFLDLSSSIESIELSNGTVVMLR